MTSEQPSSRRFPEMVTQMQSLARRNTQIEAEQEDMSQQQIQEIENEVDFSEENEEQEESAEIIVPDIITSREGKEEELISAREIREMEQDPTFKRIPDPKKTKLTRPVDLSQIIVEQPSTTTTEIVRQTPEQDEEIQQKNLARIQLQQTLKTQEGITSNIRPTIQRIGESRFASASEKIGRGIGTGVGKVARSEFVRTRPQVAREELRRVTKTGRKSLRGIAGAAGLAASRFEQSVLRPRETRQDISRPLSPQERLRFFGKSAPQTDLSKEELLLVAFGLTPARIQREETRISKELDEITIKRDALQSELDSGISDPTRKNLISTLVSAANKEINKLNQQKQAIPRVTSDMQNVAFRKLFAEQGLQRNPAGSPTTQQRNQLAKIAAHLAGSETQQTAISQQPKRGRGRPKGSKNKPKASILQPTVNVS